VKAHRSRSAQYLQPACYLFVERADMWRQGLCHEKSGRVSEAPLARGFKRLINVLHTKAPQAKFALASKRLIGLSK
jgi:hypothetical protein